MSAGPLLFLFYCHENGRLTDRLTTFPVLQGLQPAPCCDVKAMVSLCLYLRVYQCVFYLQLFWLSGGSLFSDYILIVTSLIYLLFFSLYVFPSSFNY